MSTDDVRSILGRIGAICHPCDLDLLLFFYRHPRALLTGEELVSSAGYDRERVAKSLDGLVESGLLTRSQKPSRAARLYVLEPHGAEGDLLTLLKIAATRQGRREVMRCLESGGPNGVRRAASVTKIA